MDISNKTELSLKDIFIILKQSWLLISVFVLLISILSAFYSLKLPNIYSSSALIEIRSEESSSNISNYSSLASFAGLNIDSGKDRTALVLEVIKSRDFLKELLKNHDLKKKLFAMKSYNIESKKETYNKEIYDDELEIWLKNKEPSFLTTYKKYTKSLEIGKNRLNSFITIKFNHISPEFSQEIIQIIIDEANKKLKNMILTESISKSIYLENNLKTAQNAEIKKIFSSLIEKEVQKQLLLNVREDYVISIIDSPMVPEEKIAPTRSFIVILSSFLSFIFISLVAIYRHLLKFNK